MLRIALDLGGTSLEGSRQEPRGPPSQRGRGCVVQRAAGNDLLRLPRVRQDLLRRQLEAPGCSRERHRRAEQLDELAPRGAADLRGARWKLALRRRAPLSLVEAPPLGARDRGPPAFRGQEPYVVATIELDEGVRLMSNVIDCKPADARIGSRVRLAWSPTAGGFNFPTFALCP